jgi:hypothetical protein
MRMLSPRRALQVVAGVALAATVVAAPLDATTATADSSPRPRFTLTGTGSWAIREFIGDVVVNGTGALQRESTRRIQDVLVASTVDADDGTLPAPGECEGAIATVSTYGASRVDFTMIGAGEVCGTFVQPPTSIVTHTFTGTFEVYDVTKGTRRLLGTDGFFEVVLADNGRASVFAIDT